LPDAALAVDAFLKRRSPVPGKRERRVS
jgi:hypothetical protein